jgi:hypothetical protein
MIYQLFTRSYHPWSSTERRKKKSLALLILAELLYNLLISGGIHPDPLNLVQSNADRCPWANSEGPDPLLEMGFRREQT